MKTGPLLSDRISVSLNIPLRPKFPSVNFINPEQKLKFPDPVFTLLFSAEHSLSSCRILLHGVLPGLGNYHWVTLGEVHSAEQVLSA